MLMVNTGRLLPRAAMQNFSNAYTMEDYYIPSLRHCFRNIGRRDKGVYFLQRKADRLFDKDVFAGCEGSDSHGGTDKASDSFPA